MPKTATINLDPNVREQVQTILRQLLEDRPYLRESRNVSVEDLLSFLEVEEDSSEWLPFFLENPRILMETWRKVQKTESPALETETATIQQASSEIELALTAKKEPTTLQDKAKPTKKSRIVSAEKKTPAPTEKEPAEPVREAEIFTAPAQTVVRVAEAGNEKTNNDSPAETSVYAKAIEPTSYNSPIKAELPAENNLAMEMALQASRALAEQFAIVQYYEQQLEKSNQSIEDLNKRLSQARQQQADTNEAYNSALEELAKLLATSLGTRAGEFTKLLNRVVSNRK